MLHLRTLEPGALGICSSLKPARPRSRLHTIRDVELHHSLPIDACIGHSGREHERSQFFISKRSKLVSVRRKRRDSSFSLWAMVDVPDGRLAARRSTAHSFQHDVDSPAGSCYFGNVWSEPDGDYLHDCRRCWVCRQHIIRRLYTIIGRGGIHRRSICSDFRFAGGASSLWPTNGQQHCWRPGKILGRCPVHFRVHFPWRGQLGTPRRLRRWFPGCKVSGSAQTGTARSLYRRVSVPRAHGRGNRLFGGGRSRLVLILSATQQQTPT